MRARRFSQRSHLFVLPPCLWPLSVCRRLPAVASEWINDISVIDFITVILGNLFKLCVCLCNLLVEQSENPFPLFLLIMADRIRRQMQETALGIEDETINLPFDLCEEAISETRYSLIVKPVNPRRQNLRAMASALPRLWGVGEEVSSRILENRKIQFLFQSEESMASVLRRGPWSFNEWMSVVQKWNPNHSDQDLQRIPFRVQIRGIPLHFLTERMVTTIGGRLGHFMETDFGGDGTALVDYVRVRLLWNIDDPLRFQRLFQFGDESSVLKFRYEKLRNFCSNCGVLSHDAPECPLSLNAPPPPPEDDDEDDDPGFNPDAAEENQPENNREPIDNHVTESGPEEDTQAFPKKRKVVSPSSSERITAWPLVCCEMKQGYAVEETEHQVVKRQRRESEALELRNWFMMPRNTPTQSPAMTGRHTPTPPTTNSEGTVGQKPPEPP